MWERDIYIGWDVRLWIALESMKVYEMMSTSTQLQRCFLVMMVAIWHRAFGAGQIIYYGGGSIWTTVYRYRCLGVYSRGTIIHHRTGQDRSNAGVASRS